MAKNVEININNGSSYEVLYPKTIIENVTNGVSINTMNNTVNTICNNLISKHLETIKIAKITYKGTSGQEDKVITFTFSPKIFILMANKDVGYAYFPINGNDAYPLKPTPNLLVVPLWSVIPQYKIIWFGSGSYLSLVCMFYLNIKRTNNNITLYIAKTTGKKYNNGAMDIITPNEQQIYECQYNNKYVTYTVFGLTW